MAAHGPGHGTGRQREELRPEVLAVVPRESASEGRTAPHRAIDTPSVEGMLELEGAHASMAADWQA